MSAFSRSQYSLSWAWDPSPTRPSAHRARWPSPSSLPTKSSPNTSAFCKFPSSLSPPTHALHLLFFLVADLHIDNTTVLCLRTAERGEAARCVSKCPSTGMSTRRCRSRPRLVAMRCAQHIFFPESFFFSFIFSPSFYTASTVGHLHGQHGLRYGHVLPSGDFPVRRHKCTANAALLKFTIIPIVVNLVLFLVFAEHSHIFCTKKGGAHVL